jgi:hypothetical protein
VGSQPAAITDAQQIVSQNPALSHFHEVEFSHQTRDNLMTPQAWPLSSSPPVSPQAPTEPRPAKLVNAARSKNPSVSQTPHGARAWRDRPALGGGHGFRPAQKAALPSPGTRPALADH